MDISDVVKKYVESRKAAGILCPNPLLDLFMYYQKEKKLRAKYEREIAVLRKELEYKDKTIATLLDEAEKIEKSIEKMKSCVK